MTNDKVEKDGTGIEPCVDTMVLCVYVIERRAIQPAQRSKDSSGLLFQSMCAATIPVLNMLGMSLSTCRSTWMSPEFRFADRVQGQGK